MANIRMHQEIATSKIFDNDCLSYHAEASEPRNSMQRNICEIDHFYVLRPSSSHLVVYRRDLNNNSHKERSI